MGSLGPLVQGFSTAALLTFWTRSFCHKGLSYAVENVWEHSGAGRLPPSWQSSLALLMP